MTEWHKITCKEKPYDGDIVLVGVREPDGFLGTYLAIYGNGRFYCKGTGADITHIIETWCKIPYFTAKCLDAD